MRTLNQGLLFASLALIGCGQQSQAPSIPASNQSMTNQAQNDDAIAAGLKRQNELLEEQAARLKAQDEANEEAKKREQLIDKLASDTAKITSDSRKKFAQVMTNLGRKVTPSSSYNELYAELRTLLVTRTAGISDDGEFWKVVEDTIEDWSNRIGIEDTQRHLKDAENGK